MKNKEIDDIIRQKLSNINYQIDTGEVEKVHQFVRAKQFWWQKYYWTKTTSYLLAASLLIASLSYNLYQHQTAENLEAELKQILVEKGTTAPVDHDRTVIVPAEKKAATAVQAETTKEAPTDNRLTTASAASKTQATTENSGKSASKPIKNLNSETENYVDKSTWSKDIVSQNNTKKQLKFQKKGEENINPPAKVPTEVNPTNLVSGSSESVAAGGAMIDPAAQLEEVDQSRMEEVEQLSLGKVPLLKRPMHKLEDLYTYYPLPRKIKPVRQHNLDYRIGLQGIATTSSNAVGIRGELWWKSHWSIAAGLQYRTAKLSRFDDENHFNKDRGKDFNKEYPNHPPPPVGGKLFDIRLKRSFVEVPVNINYAYPIRGGHSLMASVGSKLILKERNSVDFRIQPASNPSNQPVMKADRVERSLAVGNLNFGLGYQYAYKHLALQVMPQLELPSKKPRMNEPIVDLGLRAAVLYAF